MNLTVKVNINPAEICRNHNVFPGSPAEEHAARLVQKYAEPYVPMDTGALIGSATVNGNLLSYNTPYARRWYYQPANFQGAPKRGNYWVERMLNEGGREKITRELAEFLGVK